ncbi:hypothetical protein D3C87_1583960 [compost metagenome]
MQGQQAARVAQQFGARRGELQVARAAQQHGGAHRVFQLAQLHADGGLRAVHQRRGGRERAGVHHRHEGAQPVDLKVGVGHAGLAVYSVIE